MPADSSESTEITSSPSTPSTKKPSLPPRDAKGEPSGQHPTASGNWRKTLFRLHGWLGLNLGLLLFVICLSGTVATLSFEIDSLIDPAHRVETVSGAPVDWTAMYETVAEAFPEGQNLGVYAPGSAYVSAVPDAAAVSYVSLPNGQTRKVYLNPYTGALEGHTSFFNVQRFFRSFHRRFFDGNRGIVIVTLMALPLLLSVLSGLLFYKGWLKQMVTLRWDRGPRLRWSDLHKGAGIWGLLFSLLIAVTGVFYFVEVGFLAADNYEPLLPDPLPQVEEATLDSYGPQPDLLPPGEYVDAAKAALPGLQVHSLRLPQAPGEAVYVDGQAGNLLTRDRANKVHLHPFTGEVLGVQRSSDLGPVPWITDAADPLHFGYFGGLWTKVLWCALGLLLSFSILSGAYLWVVRSRPHPSRRSSTSGSEEESGLGPVPLLRGAVIATALTLAYLVVVGLSTANSIEEYAPKRGPEVAVADLQAGPYQVELRCQSPCDGSEPRTYVARFGGSGLPNLQAAVFTTPEGEQVELQGPARVLRASVAVPPGDTLTLSLTQRGGAVHAARFAAPSIAGSVSGAPAEAAAWPDTHPGVRWVVGAFLIGTAGCIVAWLVWVARAFQLERQKQRRRAGAGMPDG